MFGAPKTEKSRRTVWLPELATEALERHQVDQDARRRDAVVWKDYGLVFCHAAGQSAGRPLWRSQIRSAWLALLEKAHLPPTRVHDLRHTAATLLLNQGVPVKVASEMLGH